MNKRVLVINHFAAPLGAPGGTRHVELFGRLRGWDATVLASNRNYLTRQVERGDDGFYRAVWSSRYSTNGPGRILNWATFGVMALVESLHGPRPDVVYASSPHLLAALAGEIVARIRRARFVLEIRDLWPHVLVDMGQLREGSMLHRMLMGLAQHLYRRADAVVVLAEGVRRHLADEERVPAERIHLIPNGADPEDFSPGPSRSELRDRFALDGVVVAYTGAHGPANGLGLVLDAAAELRSDLPEVKFLLVGDGVEKDRLVERAAQEGLDNVEFRAPMSKVAIRDLLAAVDIGLHVLADVPLFRYGVSPNKLFDYMAAGRPVITNTPGEVSELVRSAGAGLGVAPAGIAAGVRTMVAAGDTQCASWGAAGREFMAAHGSRAVLARQLEDMLDGLLVQGSAGRFPWRSHRRGT